ncbi:MAG: hypothetical protein ACK4SJ_11205 [Sphingorhabdus sp.]
MAGSILLKLGSTLRVPLKLWQPTPSDGTTRQRLVVDSVEIWSSDLPDGVLTLQPASVPEGIDGALFLDASSELAMAALQPGKLYQVELRTIASADKRVWPAIPIEVVG